MRTNATALTQPFIPTNVVICHMVAGVIDEQDPVRSTQACGCPHQIPKICIPGSSGMSGL